MANWQNRLDLSDVWASEDVPKIANAIVERIAKVRIPRGDDVLADERQEIVYAMEDAAKSGSDSEFDKAMDRLYDWADTKLDDKWNGKALCWVEVGMFK